MPSSPHSLRVGTGSSSVGIGDTLICLACVQAAEDNKIPCTFESLPHVISWVSEVFSHYSNTEFVASLNPYCTPDANSSGTFRERKLKSYGFNPNTIARPKQFYKRTPNKNTLAVCTHCAPQWEVLRGGWRNDWQKVRELFKDYHVINLDTLCQESGRSAWDGTDITTLRRNLPRPKISAVFDILSGCSTYVGVDTGWMHAAVCLGLDVVCYVPKSCSDYNHHDWHYNLPNVTYVEFTR